MTAAKARRVSLAVVATLIVGLVGTASASAATEAYMKVEKEGKVTTLASGETRTQSFSLPAEGRLTIPNPAETIACTSAKGSGTIYNNYVGAERREGRLKSATITFEGCSVEGSSCYIDGAVSGAGKITTTAIDARLGYQPGSSENIEALLAPESGTKFTTISLEECVIEGSYEVKGTLVSGIGPSNTLQASSVQGVTASGGSQQYKTIEFPVAKESLSSEELKVGSKPATIEGALELTLSGGESLGYFTS